MAGLGLGNAFVERIVKPVRKNGPPLKLCHILLFTGFPGDIFGDLFGGFFGMGGSPFGFGGGGRGGRRRQRGEDTYHPLRY